MRKFLKNKNKILLILGLLLVFGLLFSIKALGARLETDWPPAPGGRELTATSTLVDFIDYAYRWAMLLGGLFAFFALILGGFQYLTSVGDPNKMRDAKDRIIAAILGLVLLLSTYVILNTLNPELLTIRMPTTTTPWGEGGSWEATNLSQPCEFVKLYSEPHYKGTLLATFATSTGHPLDSCKDVGDDGLWLVGWGESQAKVGSVLMKGACQLNLYEKDTCTGSFSSIAKSMPTLKWIAIDKIKGLWVLDISPTYPPVVNTEVADNIIIVGTSAQATLHGNLTNMGKADVCYGFFEYGTNKLFLDKRYPLDYKEDIELWDISPFSSTVQELEASTTYYWKAGARNEAGINYGTTATFTTP